MLRERLWNAEFGVGGMASKPMRPGERFSTGGGWPIVRLGRRPSAANEGVTVRLRGSAGEAWRPFCPPP